MRIAFMGTPDFAVPTLDALLDAGHEVVAVYTQPPRPAGRGKALLPSPVQKRAEAAGLELRSPVSLKGAEAQAAFAALQLDAAVVAAYGLILPAPILSAPRHGCLNVHASLLPRPASARSWRGTPRRASPSCRWRRGWIRGRCCSNGRWKLKIRMPANLLINWQIWAP